MIRITVRSDQCGPQLQLHASRDAHLCRNLTEVRRALPAFQHGPIAGEGFVVSIAEKVPPSLDFFYASWYGGMRCPHQTLRPLRDWPGDGTHRAQRSNHGALRGCASGYLPSGGEAWRGRAARKPRPRRSILQRGAPMLPTDARSGQVFQTVSDQRAWCVVASTECTCRGGPSVDGIAGTRVMGSHWIASMLIRQHRRLFAGRRRRERGGSRRRDGLPAPSGD